MVTLYRLDETAAGIAVTFAVSAGEDRWQGGHLAPGKFAPVITGGREFVTGPKRAPTKPRLVPRIWGVPPPPNADDPARGIYTVRNPDSPFWIGNLRNHEFRCLVPATAFMECGQSRTQTSHSPTVRKQQQWYSIADQKLFAFAGVWKDSEVPSFAILSCPANAELKSIGCDRMPVILPAHGGAWETWLFADWRRAASLLQPYSSSMMQGIEPSGSDG